MRFLPTPALQRAIPIATVLVMAAILFGRLDALLLATPFLVWLTWAMISRPADTGSAVTMAPSGHVAVGEGDAIGWTITSPDRGVVAAAWKPVTNVNIDGSHQVGSHSISGEFHPASWGRYTLGPPTVAVSDSSGAWRAQPQLPEITMTVTPAGEALSRDIDIRRPIGISGSHTSMHRGSGAAVATVREFQPGDRLRHLHWRITARTGRPHVVANYSDRDTQIVVVLDTLSEITDAHQDQSSLDPTIRAMSSIVQHYVRIGDRVALHDLGSWIGSVPHGTGQRQAARILNAGARANRTQRPAPHISKVPAPTAGAQVFIISPLLESGVLDEAVRLRNLGSQVICIDVLPDRAGSLAALGDDDTGFLPEALLLLRAKRDRALVRLQEMGIPVVTWAGPDSLATLLIAMGASSHAPRNHNAGH